ncbi:MAG: sigma-70 family RNA polymerase sigma factor [Lachnospiraceae bacterium]|nr:sigma-70 family RNA polymerase sigma factor [Lachnospiraceae bacterium]
MDRKPFEQVFDEYYEKLYNYVYMRLLNRENTEDIVSDSFFKALSAYDRFDPEKASVYTWLCTIATNTLYDHLRKNKTGKVVSLEDYLDMGMELSRPDEELERFIDDDAKRAYMILCQLSQKERGLISMRYGMELSYKQMAELLSSNDKAVAKQMERLLDKCKKIAMKNNI